MNISYDYYYNKNKNINIINNVKKIFILIIILNLFMDINLWIKFVDNVKFIYE